MAGGLLKPKYTILGADVAGRVEAVGTNVKQFHPGDEVFGDIKAVGWEVSLSMSVPAKMLWC
jgi:NADPH:quinone reductase-like Zn-dependent oxidoreductase